MIGIEVAVVGRGRARKKGYSQVVLEDTPHLYWRLGETSGQMLDTSGNGRASTSVAAGLSRGQAGLTLDGDKACAGIAGTTAQIIRTGEALAALSAASLEIVVRMPSTPPSTPGTIKTFAGRNSRMLVQVDVATMAVRAAVSGSTSGFVTATGASNTAPINTLLHLVLTATGGVMKVYVNGVERATTTYTGTIGVADTADWIVANDPIACTYDEFAFYTTALSPTRVAAHYEALAA